ncbi:MAG: metal ABC transporter permease, partial [Candidatus Bipolaricaulaceae bacterium]
MIAFFSAPLSFGFFVRAMIAAMAASAACATVGAFVILRGMTFLGDAIAHAILPGVAVGYLVHRGERSAVFYWALGTAVITSLA